MSIDRSNINPEEIVLAYLNNRSGHEIAREYGVSHQYVYNILKENGVELRSQSQALKSYYERNQ